MCASNHKQLWLSEFNEEEIDTPFVMLAHTPMVEREHRLGADLDDGHTPYLHHWDSVEIDLFDTLPTAKNSTSHSKTFCVVQDTFIHSNL